ncbi:hypothetical protein CVT23_08925 [Minwuia thermotolerans]|uniref:Uncharacterized protein n=2 Tax=Minwuia thermotolerans TaxID=2056226 RepID=A0A2M9G2E4_9PROT|nr:hypothetical protein CVT23_08925 [Minwuia thermotolerans]
MTPLAAVFVHNMLDLPQPSDDQVAAGYFAEIAALHAATVRRLKYSDEDAWRLIEEMVRGRSTEMSAALFELLSPQTREMLRQQNDGPGRPRDPEVATADALISQAVGTLAASRKKGELDAIRILLKRVKREHAEVNPLVARCRDYGLDLTAATEDSIRSRLRRHRQRESGR